MANAAHHVAAVVVDDKVYIFGGFVSPEGLGGWSSVANVWVYDPAKNIWTRKALMPTPRSGMGYAVLDGKLFTFGGETASRETLLWGRFATRR